MRLMNRLGIVTTTLAVVLCVPSGHAQDTPRDLSGTVTDQHHEPLRGAIVTLENESTQAILTYVTDKTGHYNFKRISGNTDYRFYATYRGHQSSKKSLGMFDSKTAPVVDLEIKLE